MQNNTVSDLPCTPGVQQTPTSLPASILCALFTQHQTKRRRIVGCWRGCLGQGSVPRRCLPGQNKQLTWKKELSEHCLHRDSERGLFWQYFSYIWKSSRCKGSRKASHPQGPSPAGQQTRPTPKLCVLLSLLPTLISQSDRVWVKKALLGITADHRHGHDGCSAPSLLATSCHRQPGCWYRGPGASHSTDVTEVLQSVTNQEKHWPSSLLYTWKWVTHPV